MRLEDFLHRLEGVHKSGEQYIAKCPAHEDQKASLSIASGKDGRILLKCHAGCEVKDICARMGINTMDLFPEEQKANSPVVATYDYTDENGKLLAQKLRRADKTFIWRRPSPNGWYYNRQGVTQTLYHMEEIKGSETIFIVEGEKDADTLKRIGKTAVSPPDGAGGKWKDSFTEILAGKDIIIIQDNDKPGKTFANETANLLTGKAKSVKILDLTRIWDKLPEHGDTTDILEHFGSSEGFKAIKELAAKTDIFTAGDTKDIDGLHISIEVVQKVLDILGITVRYNVMAKENEIKGMPEYYSDMNAVNTLPVYLYDYLRACGVKGVRKEIITDYLNCIADMNHFNPVEDYLKDGTWDKKDRLTEIYRILNVSEEKYQTYIRKWLIQCVALALNSEKKPIGAEGVLVLQGEQGIAKTSFFRILSPYPRWFIEGAILDMSNRDTLIKALSGWITELGELDSTLKREQSILKAFITQPEDKIRQPYARNPVRNARRTSFCGTVNPKDYLRDETGSRRFWTIPIENIDKKALFSLSSDFIHQLWLQIYQMYLENKSGFRLTEKEMETLQKDNFEFDIPLPFEEEIRGILDYSLPVEQWEWWRACDLVSKIPGYPSARQIGKCIAKISSELWGQCIEKGVLQKCPSNRRHKRKIHGSWEFYIPLQHYGNQIGHMGNQKGIENLIHHPQQNATAT